MKLSSATSGAIAELQAATWLMERGLEVFRNVSPAGAADIIVREPQTGKMLPVDVKSVSAPYVRANGSLFYPKSTLRGDAHRLMVVGGQVLGFLSNSGEHYWPFEGSAELALQLTEDMVEAEPDHSQWDHEEALASRMVEALEFLNSRSPAEPRGTPLAA